MIKASLHEFVHQGKLGPFHSTTTRADLLRVIGPPDSETYPGILVYSHIGFDLAEIANPRCRIQIAFPHEANLRRQGKDWTDAEKSEYFKDWPDRRFDWDLDVFVPGVTDTDLSIVREDFQRSELIYPTDDSMRVYYKVIPNIELTFQRTSQGRHELSHMALHPE